MKSRLNVSGVVYFQHQDGQQIAAEVKYGRWVSSDELAYGPKRFTATREPKKLEFGWVEKVALIVLANCEPSVDGTGQEPVVVLVNGWRVLPGETFVGSPHDDVVVRCDGGDEAKCTLLVVPK